MLVPTKFQSLLYSLGRRGRKEGGEEEEEHLLQRRLAREILRVTEDKSIVCKRERKICARERVGVEEERWPLLEPLRKWNYFPSRERERGRGSPPSLLLHAQTHMHRREGIRGRKERLSLPYTLMCALAEERGRRGRM